MTTRDIVGRRIAARLLVEHRALKNDVRIEPLRSLRDPFVTGLEIDRGEFKRKAGLRAIAAR